MRKRLLLLFAVLAMAINASAYDFEVDGICYNYVSQEELTCEVTLKWGNGNSYSGIKEGTGTFCPFEGSGMRGTMTCPLSRQR